MVVFGPLCPIKAVWHPSFMMEATCAVGGLAAVTSFGKDEVSNSKSAEQPW